MTLLTQKKKVKIDAEYNPITSTSRATEVSAKFSL